MYSVYMVRCADGTYYTGIARDVAARVQAHNVSPHGAKYTKARRPVQLVYAEPALDRAVAQRREYAIKQLTRAEKQVLIDRYAQTSSPS